MVARWLIAGSVAACLVPSAWGQITFNQDNTALPPFGGYVPGAGATISFSNAGGFTFRQGSFDLALPPFGGYVPGAGATITFPNAAQMATLRNRDAAAIRRSQQRAAQAERVRTLRRRRAAESLLRKGQHAASQGNSDLARMYYRMGLKRNSSYVNDTLRSHIDKLK